MVVFQLSRVKWIPQKIDLYLPQASDATELPTLLFMHGGYWTHGYKEWLGFMAPAFVSLPAIFISVGYRLAPAAPYPAALADCLSALAWTHKHIAAYGGSSRRLFIGGHSAGGHLAALVTLRPSLFAAYGLPDHAISGIVSRTPIWGLHFLQISCSRIVPTITCYCVACQSLRPMRCPEKV